jgi:predicted NAD-dependent protein-ADP-ribosyltransferase YbiA (DUF1768 family)
MENLNEINLKEKCLEEIINIGFEGKTETEQMLSNLAYSPFVLNGKHYNSVEGLWQGFKFDDEKKREEIAQLWGIEAKKAGRKAPKATEFEYQGEKFKVGSEEHQNLMRQAIKAKLEQNPHVLKLLLATGQKKITHILVDPQTGYIHPDSQTIPGKTFCGFLTELREEFRGK